MGAVRAITIGKTREEAFDLAVATTGHVWDDYFGSFGMYEAFRVPGDPKDRPVKFANKAEATKRMIETGYQLCGTLDDVKRQMEDLHTVYGTGGNLSALVVELLLSGPLTQACARRTARLHGEADAHVQVISRSVPLQASSTRALAGTHLRDVWRWWTTTHRFTRTQVVGRSRAVVPPTCFTRLACAMAIVWPQALPNRAGIVIAFLASQRLGALSGWVIASVLVGARKTAQFSSMRAPEHLSRH